MMAFLPILSSLFTTQTRYRSFQLLSHCLSSWRNIFSALKTYKEIHGNFDIPFEFRTPINDQTWPISARDINLGHTAYNIRRGSSFRNHKEDLDAIGFEWRCDGIGIDKDNQMDQMIVKIKEALIKYKEIHKNMRVPTKFIIPSDNDLWPEHLWNIHLGKIVNHIRNRHLFSIYKDELLEIGFDFSRQSPLPYGWQSVKTSILTYKSIYKNVNIPWGFIIPKDDDRWPIGVRGILLGPVYGNIKRGQSYRQHTKELEELGIYVFSQYSFENVKNCIVIYKELNGGDLKVPISFTVPAEDDRWPLACKYMPLGGILYNISHNEMFADRKDELLEIGFEFGCRRKFVWEDVKEAIIVYKTIHGNFEIPKTFEIPGIGNSDPYAGLAAAGVDSPSLSPWPRKLWGMRLGEVVYSIMCFDSYKNRAEELLEIGFKFDEKPSFRRYGLRPTGKTFLTSKIMRKKN